MIHGSSSFPTVHTSTGSLRKQLQDNLLANRGPEHSPTFHLPPMERPPETCYVRTRGDLVLAVVRKKELLKCVDDVSFRRLKTAAHPVRIKVMPGWTYLFGLCCASPFPALRCIKGSVSTVF